MSKNNTSPEMATYEAMLAFAENITMLREKRKQTPEQLARVLNISIADYAKLENASIELDLFLICAIAEHYQVPPATLVMSAEAFLQIEAELQDEYDYMVHHCEETGYELTDLVLTNEMIEQQIRDIKEQNGL